MSKLNKVSLAMAAAFFMVMGGVANAGDLTSFGNVNANLATSSAKADAAQARADAAYALAQVNSGKIASGGLTVAATGLQWDGSKICTGGLSSTISICYEIKNGFVGSSVLFTDYPSSAWRKGFSYNVNYKPLRVARTTVSYIHVSPPKVASIWTYHTGSGQPYDWASNIAFN